MEQLNKFEEKRYIEHQLPEQDQNTNFPQLTAEVMKILINDIIEFEKEINPNSLYCLSSTDEKTLEDDMYIGIGGYMYTYLRLYQFWSKQSDKIDEIRQYIPQLKDEELFKIIDAKRYLQEAEQCLLKLIQLPDEDEKSPTNVSFFFSRCGVYTLACILYYNLQNVEKFNEYIQKILAYKKKIIQNINSHELGWELLYGVPGYLYCLLELQKNFQYQDTLNEQYRINIETHVIEICEFIIEHGKKKSQDQKQLFFSFYKREYLGAAHGYFGILYMLLKAYQLNENAFKKYQNQKQIQDYLQIIDMTFKKCIQNQMKTGNFPMFVGSEEDYLVQFCHGASGSILPLILGSKIYKNQQFLTVALEAGNCVWKYGILKKGFNLCHGITGNGYAFLQLYKESKNKLWYNRALRFVLASQNKNITKEINNFEHHDRQVKGVSNHPYSLMEGKAGNICFYMDCINPEESEFPGYEI